MMRSSRLKAVLTYAGLLAILALFLLPIVWTLFTSLKTHVDAWTLPPKWLFTPTLHNYSEILIEKSFGRFSVNSAVVAVVSTAVSLVVGSLTAYGLERFRIPGKNVIFFAFFWAYMVPAIVIALPLYLVAAELGLLDTYLLLILSHSTFNTAFATWMMRGFFQDVPREIEECALIDGCTQLGVLVRVTVPLAAPGLAVTSVFCLMYSWNDFPFALILSGFSTKTLPVAVGTLETPFGTFWGQIAAAVFVGVVPIFIFTVLVQKWLVRGLSFGAIK
jgi:multiple sugar transport system permease protein